MPDPLDDTPAINEAARKALSKAAVACRRIGWFSFWTQLSLSIVSAGILLFSVAFTSQVRCMPFFPGLACLCCCLKVGVQSKWAAWAQR